MEALRVVTAASSRVRLRLGIVARDRPVAPNQSDGHGHYGHTRHDRPGLVFLAKSGASLEVSRPLQHTSAASRAIFRRRPASGRVPLRRFALTDRPRAQMPRTFTIGKHVALAVFRFLSEIRAASLDPADAFGVSSAIPHSAASFVDARRTNRIVSTRVPVVYGPSRGCGR